MPTMRAFLRALAFCTAMTPATSALADPLWGSTWNWVSYGAEPTAVGGTVPAAPVTPAHPAPADPTARDDSRGSSVQVGAFSTKSPETTTTTVLGSVPSTVPMPASTGSGVTAGSAPSSSATAGTTADAYINFTTGPYPEASALTNGAAQAWYLSPIVERLFGGVPSNQQQTDFANEVLKDVNRTFALSGLSPIVTDNPATPANHTISVVSNTSYSPNPNAGGITDVGHNGFAFMDKLSAATSETDLEWALAHIISHELMHAFGVAVHHDKTGKFLDTASATWSVLTNPKTVFSQAAVQDILAHDYGRPNTAGKSSAGLVDGDLAIQPQPVPEPATPALWAALGAVGWLARRRRAAGDAKGARNRSSMVGS